MMITNPFAGLFKGRNKDNPAKPNPPEPMPEVKPEVKPDIKADAGADAPMNAPVPVKELLASMERTTVALSRSGMDEAVIAEHTQSLDAMKQEIAGLGEVMAIPELSTALAAMFEKSLIKVFQYGDDASIQDVKNKIFNAINALSQPDALQNQRLSAIDVYQFAIKGEMWATEHLISERKVEYREYAKKYNVVDEFSDRPEFMVKLAALITNLNNQNEASKKQLEILETRRMLIQTDESGRATREILIETSKYLNNLPTVEEILKTASEIEELKKRLMAESRYETKVLTREIKGVDATMAELDAELFGESAKAKNASEQTAEATSEPVASPQRVQWPSY